MASGTDRHVKAWGWFQIRMEGCHYVALCGRVELFIYLSHNNQPTCDFIVGALVEKLGMQHVQMAVGIVNILLG